MAAVAYAGQCLCGGDADLVPAHFREQDGRPGFALAVDGSVEQVGREARGAREEVCHGLVSGQADDREPAAGAEHPGHGGQRGGEVHVVQRGVGADEVEACFGEVVGQEVGLDEGDSGWAGGAGSGHGDHARVTVDAGHLGTAGGEPAGQHPVSAADVERRAAAGRDGTEDDRLVVHIVVPIVGPSHHASRVRRIPLGLCAR